MTDFAKRRTLKGIAAAATGTATAGFATHSQAEINANSTAVESLEKDRHLAIYTRMSSSANDVEAVFVNAGTDTLTIDTLTPHEVTTFRGRFDVSVLTAEKPLVLAPGQSVSLGMTPHGHRMQWNELMQQGQSLSRALQTSATAVTTDGMPVHISVNETLPFT